MGIVAEFNMYGSIDAYIDDVKMNIPNETANRYRRIIAEWEAEGNQIKPYVPKAIPRLVLKRTIVDRLHLAGKLELARAALDAAPLYTRERWNVRDSVYSDDPDTIALLTSIGADVNAILAE